MKGGVGGLIGKKKKNTAAGAITGAAIGRYMDKQAEELQRDLASAKVERIGEGIKITFDSGMQQNRRVEVAIFANKRLKKAAEKGQI